VTEPTLAEARRLFFRLWRIRHGRLALRASRAFADLAERLLPMDLLRP
jgi:hypothetical protein